MFLRPITSLLTAALLASTVATVTASAAGAAKTPTGCSALTRSLVAADGYSSATGPVVTADNYKNVDANAANAVGTTYDFGAQALIVGCLDPAHLGAAWKAQGFSGKATNAQGFMDQLVKASSGAMTKTKVGPVTDYLDYGNGNGNGKEDGLGSLAKARSLRLDAWVANAKYVVLTFSAPAGPPSQALLACLASSLTVLK